MNDTNETNNRAFDCKHSDAVVNVKVKQKVIDDVYMDIADARMVRLKDSCPYNYKGYIPVVFCQSHCEKYEKEDADET